MDSVPDEPAGRPSPSIFRDIAPQPVGTGLVAATVGYGSSVAIVIHGLSAVGATEAQTAFGLASLCIMMGLSGVILSLATRMPISVAWSTPGMALLGSMAGVQGGFPAAAGAFLVAGLLIMLTGLWTPLGRLVALIPRAISSAMLAGIVLKLCLAPFLALGQGGGLEAALVLAVIATWVVVGRFYRLWAAPAALLVALLALAVTTSGSPSLDLVPHAAFVVPAFDWPSMISIALPLYVVTMASQNIPGLAVLATFGFRPPTRPIFLATGGASVAGAVLGSPTINLAAITAALCAGPDAHRDPTRRYVSAIVAGLLYTALGLLSVPATALVTHSSPVLIEAVAGLALTGALGSSLLGAVQEDEERVPALLTFLVTASGLTALGIGAAFWGLVAGVVAHLLYRTGRRRAP